VAELSKEDSAKASELYKRLKAAEQEYAGFKIQSNRSRAPLWLRRCRVSALRVSNAQADISSSSCHLNGVAASSSRLIFDS